jgi:ABC-type phosphate/phosphonate transport system substrate-binding protein
MSFLIRAFLPLIATLCLPLVAVADIKIALNSPRGELATLQQWYKLEEYLTQSLGTKVIVTPLLVTAIVDAGAKKEYDFIFANPMQTLILREKYGYTLLATLNQKNGAHFAGVIIANPRTGIKQGVDLRGKKVIGLSADASAAHVFQGYHLQQLGVDMYKDLASYREAKKLDDIVLAVKAGLFDAGFIRTGVLETMYEQGKLKAGDVIIVDERKTPGFNLIHTTELYPEWFFCAKPGLDPALQENMKKALLQLKAEDELAQTANIQGFVDALPLDGLLEVVKSLKIAPFDLP